MSLPAGLGKELKWHVHYLKIPQQSVCITFDVSAMFVRYIYRRQILTSKVDPRCHRSCSLTSIRQTGQTALI